MQLTCFRSILCFSSEFCEGAEYRLYFNRAAHSYWGGKSRTYLTRFYGVLAPDSRYRESVTPLSARKVEPATADVEADGLEEPDPRAGRRQGVCCTPAAGSAKRVPAARAPPPGGCKPPQEPRALG